MAYTKTTWTNETPQSSPVKYQIHDDSLGRLANSATITLVTSVTPGTAVNATNLNHLEDGLVAAAAIADNAHSDATQALADAATAQATATAAATAWQTNGVMCRVHENLQSIPTGGSYTAISFTVEDFDTSTLFSLGAPTRITFPIAGYYELHLYAIGAANQTVIYRKNGSGSLTDGFDNGSKASFESTMIAHFAASDYVEVIARHGEAGSINTTVYLFVRLIKKD